jgi:Protein of unknown function (DUF2914)
MKKTIGIITLLAMSQAAFSKEVPTEAQLIESDVAVETTPAATPAEAPATAMEEQSGFSRGSVVRSAFTRDIAEREPTENLQNLTNENGQVKFFTELRDMSGQTAIHRWQYEGKVVAEVEFSVKGPRWRVWSSKSFVPQWTGEWKVSVVNGAGEVISEKSLSYDIATAPTPIEAAPAPAAASMTEEEAPAESMK